MEMNAAVCRCIGIDACVTLVHLTNNNIMETATRLLIKDIMDRRIVSAPCSASTNSNSCGLWVTHCLSFVVVRLLSMKKSDSVRHNVRRTFTPPLRTKKPLRHWCARALAHYSSKSFLFYKSID